MPIELDVRTLTQPACGMDGVTRPPRTRESKRLLILLNPGRVSRHYMEGLVNAARRLGIEYRTIEMGSVWERQRTDRDGLTRDMAAMIASERIGAVIGYVLNGAFEMHGTVGPDGRLRSFFEAMGIPHLMLWTDHPQWASEKLALHPRVQAVLKSPNNFHFLKSEAAAEEIRRVLGWANCFGMPVAEDPELIKPRRDVTSDFDVVAVLGSPPRLDARLKPFIEHDAPDEGAIMTIVAADVREKVRALWRRDVPESMWTLFDQMGDEWADRRRADVKTAAVRHLPELTSLHGEAMQWLLRHPNTYFDAIEHLWQFGGWQRTFYLCYLSRYFRTAVFGADWREVGLGGGEWVSYRDQSAAYARGKIAINISQGSEEEGISHKPFQIAASGVPMIHIDRKGLSECFNVGAEVATFESPADACDVIADLLANPSRRDSMAAAARARLERDHTWDRRLSQMLVTAGSPVGAVLQL